ncbi:hypothetical protein JAAARDRAFT_55864 [Jaapia argillacea MUCL 33604]|uniref:Uncharacterized protein n=1 Tax=Jaapia argillacea MUCL 33604 TaxID=933084 RepID=A0A067QCD3_9AGAM|nr:hypothetical protein JAAARDRAFT_55864 [Jaapia argillacea MUCL 33604]
MNESPSTFIAPEGVYSVTEEHKPLPSHLVPAPTLYPTRITAVTVRFPALKSGASQGLAQLLGGNKDNRKEKEREKEKEKEKIAKEDSVSLSSSDTEANTSPDPSGPSDTVPPTPQLSHDQPHTIFSHPLGGKRKTISRPKHNMRTTSSTFITRLQSAEGLTKTLQSKQGEITFLFYNSSKNFLWAEAGAKAKEPLARITFTAYPTCHDVNIATASHERIDVIIGFNTGDLVWFDPISSRYGRLNKGGCITNSPCTSVRWVPSLPALFLVSHADGSIIVYDKERDDGVFTPQDPYSLIPVSPSVDPTNNSARPPQSDSLAPPTTTDLLSTMVKGEWNPLDRIFVTMPPWHPGTAGGVGQQGYGIMPSGRQEKEKTAKNPVSHWRVTRKSVLDFVFSPDGKYVAAISEDGCMRIIDALAEQLVDCYASYFGAMTCVAWSPDGRFVITGGQDDLVTIFSPWEQRVIARCQGHSSFVSAIAFDDLRCDGRTYRFGSVGEDNKLILWDFSSGALHRPKLQATHHQRLSMSSSVSLAFRRDRSTLHLPPGTDGAPLSPLPRYHPAPSRNEIAVVQPVLIKAIEGDLLTDTAFLPKGLLTASKGGTIKLWIRPLALRPRHTMKAGNGGTRAHSITDVRDLIV